MVNFDFLYCHLSIVTVSSTDNCHIQSVPWLHRAEGVPGHHGRRALCLPGRHTQRWPCRQPAYNREQRTRRRAPGHHQCPLLGHLHHCAAGRPLPHFRHPRSWRDGGGERRLTALPARLPTQRAHQRSRAEPRTTAGGERWTIAAGQHGPRRPARACHIQMQGDAAGRRRLLPVVCLRRPHNRRRAVLYGSVRSTAGPESSSSQHAGAERSQDSTRF